jgi:hypothetical protein
MSFSSTICLRESEQTYLDARHGKRKRTLTIENTLNCSSEVSLNESVAFNAALPSGVHHLAEIAHIVSMF